MSRHGGECTFAGLGEEEAALVVPSDRHHVRGEGAPLDWLVHCYSRPDARLSRSDRKNL